MKKILTISVASYNVEKTLPDTLNSLICDRKIMDKLEVFIVDDGSTDGTVSVAKSFEQSYPNTFFYINKTNGGHGSTLNYSIHHATAKYFKMLDGDDWVETGALIDLVNILENSDVDVVISPYKRIFQDKGEPEYVNRHDMVVGREYDISELLPNKLERLHAHEVTVKTECLRKTFFDITEKCVYTDDEYLSNVIRNADTYIKTDREIYCYRLGIAGQTVSLEGRIKHMHDAKRVALAMLAHNKEAVLGLSKEKEAYLYKFIAGSIIFQINNYLLLNDFQNVIAEIYDFRNSIIDLNEGIWESYVETDNVLILFNKLKSIYQSTDEYKYIVMGAGRYGVIAVRLLKKTVSINCFADNQADAFKDRVILGKEVLLTKDALDRYPDSKIMISSIKNYEKIRYQLVEMGVDSDRII